MDGDDHWTSWLPFQFSPHDRFQKNSLLIFKYFRSITSKLFTKLVYIVVYDHKVVANAATNGICHLRYCLRYISKLSNDSVKGTTLGIVSLTEYTTSLSIWTSTTGRSRLLRASKDRAEDVTVSGSYVNANPRTLPLAPL